VFSSHDDPPPDAAQDLILGDEIAACSHQHLENIEGTVPERNRHAVDNELAPIREQLAVAELHDGRTPSVSGMAKASIDPLRITARVRLSAGDLALNNPRPPWRNRANSFTNPLILRIRRPVPRMSVICQLFTKDSSARSR
jgi:hypothetical protein